MPTAQTIYAETVRQLPAQERLRLATLILQDLTMAELPVVEDAEVIDMPPLPPVVHLRSPRLLSREDSARLKKEIVENPNDAQI